MIERAGRLLAIASDERHRRAAVEQRHRGCDLLLTDGKFPRDLSVNGMSSRALLMRKYRLRGPDRRSGPAAGAHMQVGALIFEAPAGDLAAIDIASVEQRFGERSSANRCHPIPFTEVSTAAGAWHWYRDRRCSTLQSATLTGGAAQCIPP